PEVYLGVKLSSDERAVITNVLPGSPAQNAGLDRGDQLLAINNAQTNAANLVESLSGYHAGDRVSVTVFRARQLRNFEVVLAGGGNISYHIKRLENALDGQQRVLAAWLANTK